MSRPRGRRRTPSGPPHVRIYAHEMATPAWDTLDTDARALLVLMRSMWTDTARHHVHMSIRTIMDRLHIGQRRATAARDALVERGWIVLLERGTFARKIRHASVYAVSMPDEPDAPREYMSWRATVAGTATDTPPRAAAAQKNTVAVVNTDGSRGGYRGRSADPSRPRVGSRGGYRDPGFLGSVGSCHGYTDTVTTVWCTPDRAVPDPDDAQDGDTWTH